MLWRLVPQNLSGSSAVQLFSSIWRTCWHAFHAHQDRQACVCSCSDLLQAKNWIDQAMHYAYSKKQEKSPIENRASDDREGKKEVTIRRNFISRLGFLDDRWTMKWRKFGLSFGFGWWQRSDQSPRREKRRWRRRSTRMRDLGWLVSLFWKERVVYGSTVVCS